MKKLLCLYVLSHIILFADCGKPVIKKITEFSDTFYDDLKQRCLKHNQGINIPIENATTSFRNCIRGTINFEIAKKEYAKALDEDTLNEFRNKYCKRRTRVSQCFDKFLSTFEPCFEKKENGIKKTIMSLFTGFTTFLCKEDFNNIPKLLNDESEKCISASLPALKSCFNTNFKSVFGQQPRMLWAISKIMTTRKYCKEMQNFEQCSISTFDTCTTMTLKEVYTRLIENIKTESDCYAIGNPQIQRIDKNHDSDNGISTTYYEINKNSSTYGNGQENQNEMDYTDYSDVSEATKMTKNSAQYHLVDFFICYSIFIVTFIQYY